MKIFLAGQNGLVGAAIYRKLIEKKYKNIITIDKKKLDLLNQNSVFKFIKKFEEEDGFCNINEPKDTFMIN